VGGGGRARGTGLLTRPPPLYATPGKRKTTAGAERGALCGECGEATRDRAGWLMCGECNAAAHRFCLGLRPSSQLGNKYVCCRCEAWRAWEGGDAAVRAAERVSRDITVLEGEALEMSTADTYRYRLETVRRWAVGVGFTEEDAFPSGVREPMAEVVALGVIAHGSRAWSPAYMRGIKTAIGEWHKSKGAANPMESERARGVMKAARKRALKLGHAGRGPKAPVTRDLLVALVHWLELRAAQDERRKELYHRDQAWAVLGFHGLLRRSELGGLRMKDVVVDKVGRRVKVFIKKSKTDAGVGQWVWLAWVSASGVEIGDIVGRWTAARWRVGARDGEAFFTAWDKKSNSLTRKPLEVKGEALVQRFKRQLRAMSAAFGMGLRVEEYGSHSLRRGGANALKESGVPAALIQEHGRWTSDCYKRYLERSAEERLSLTRGM
jgi:integrase